MKYRSRFTSFFLIMILFNLAANFAHPATPTVIKELGLHDYMFGATLAYNDVHQFPPLSFWGKINNYISSRTSLLICCCGYGLAQLWFAYASTERRSSSPECLPDCSQAELFVKAFTYVVNAARPEDQGRFLTYTATIKSVASAFGYMIGGFLGEISVRLSFLAQAALLIIVAFLFYAVCQPDGTTT